MKKVVFGSLIAIAALWTGCENGACCMGSKADDAKPGIDDKGNVAPVAVISNKDGAIYQVNEEITLDGSTSSDTDGKVVSWDWSVGNNKYSGELQNISFETVGEKVVILTVTDDDGLQSTAQIVVQVNGTDEPPVAVITTSQNTAPITHQKPYTFSCLDSYDQDENGESIAECKWNISSYNANGNKFGDCPIKDVSPGIVSITPCLGSSYVVAILEVTDDEGETNSTSQRFDIK